MLICTAYPAKAINCLMSIIRLYNENKKENKKTETIVIGIFLLKIHKNCTS